MCEKCEDKGWIYVRGFGAGLCMDCDLQPRHRGEYRTVSQDGTINWNRDPEPDEVQYARDNVPWAALHREDNREADEAVQDQLMQQINDQMQEAANRIARRAERAAAGQI